MNDQTNEWNLWNLMWTAAFDEGGLEELEQRRMKLKEMPVPAIEGIRRFGTFVSTLRRKCKVTPVCFAHETDIPLRYILFLEAGVLFPSELTEDILTKIDLFFLGFFPKAPVVSKMAKDLMDLPLFIEDFWTTTKEITEDPHIN